MAKATFHYNPIPHQQEYQNDVNSKILHLSGGFGSGKTFALVMKTMKLSYLNRGFSGGFMSPSFTDFKKDVLPTMEDILQENKVKYVYKSLQTFQFPWTSKPLYIVTGEKPLRGPNWGYGGINELTLIPLMRFREFLSRVRLKGAPCPQIATNGTPEGFASEYYEPFIEKPFNSGLRIIYGDTRDNAKNLADDYIPTMLSAFDTKMQDAYLKGLFVNMQAGRFYYAHDQRLNEDRKIVENKDFDVHCALDFNVEFMTATFWHYDGSLKGFDQIVIEDNADIDRMCDSMMERGYHPDRTIIYPDPSGKNRKTTGKSEIEALRQNGYTRIKYKPTAPTFRARQLNTNNLLEKGIVKYNPDTMPSMRKDFMAVTQDPATLEKVKTNPKLTHASDGFDYMCDHLFPTSGKRTESRIYKYK